MLETRPVDGLDAALLVADEACFLERALGNGDPSSAGEL
jgi:hypothetical protein